MQKYIDAVIGESGRPISGASVTVYMAGTQTLATIFSNNGVTAQANPFTADSTGMFSFYAADGRYDIVITSSTANKSLTDILFEDTITIADFSSPAIADASGGSILVEADTSTTIANGASLASRYRGEGRIITADGNKRARWFSSVKSAPALLGNYNSVDTAFNGDWSRCHFPIEHRITGNSTLGTPSTGYLYTPEAYASYTNLFNSSGWNEGTATNIGRTTAVAHYVQATNVGQGDTMCFAANCFVSGTRSGSTKFIANPAGTLIAGQVTAGSDGVYLNPVEIDLKDGGFDVAGIGAVFNLDRTNAAGAKSSVWIGLRIQNIGSAICDNVISATGKFQVGIDLAMSNLDFGTNKAAISLKANDKIYFNSNALASGSLDANWRTTGFNGDYISYSTGINGLLFVVGGVPAIQCTSSQATITVPLVPTSTFKHSGLTFGVFSTTPTAQLTGFGTPTGNSIVANFPGATATLLQTSQTVAQILAYLKQLGFIGA